MHNPRFGIKGYLKPLLVEKTGIPLPFFFKHNVDKMLTANEKILVNKQIKAAEDLKLENESKTRLKEVVYDLSELKKGIKAGHHKTSHKPQMLELLDSLSDKVYSQYHDSVLPRALKVRAIFDKIANYFFNDIGGKGGNSNDPAFPYGS